MSFGFGVGDFIAVINEVSKLRKAVVGAPPQFKELSDELRALQAVVHDVDASLSDVELDGNQKNDLTAIAKSCRNTLDDIEKVVNQYSAKESNRIGRIWRRVTWDSDELGRLRDRVCVNIGNLNAFNGRLARIQISDVLMNMSDEHDQLCLDWLSSTSHAIQQEKYGDLRQPGSGKWLLDSQMFMEWIRVQQQTLFCPGIPGAGKTIIVSAVIDEVNNIYKDNPEVGIAYIYSNFQYLHDDRQKINSLMASIARQLLQSMQKMPPSILKMFNTHRSKGTRPSTSELFEVFLSIIDKLQRVFLIVDALDELDDPNKFLDQIFGLQRTEKVSFLATSRFMPEIVARFEGMPLLEIQASREDVTNYLSTSLKDMPYLSKQPRLHPEIIKEICDAVDGMFLLARLYLNSLSGKLTPKAIRTELREFTGGSQTYDDVYDKTMERITDQRPDIRTTALGVLAWITYAKRPLTPVELQHALAVELGEPDFDEDNIADIDDLISVCAGLVTITIDGSRTVVRLIHHTAQEYFEQKLISWLPGLQQTIATACITYISYETFATGSCSADAEFETRLETYPLYAYAAKTWGHHVQDQPIFHPFLMVFLQDNHKTDACGQVLFAQKGFKSHGAYSTDVPLGATGLHLAAYFGLENTAVALLERCDLLSKMDSLGRTPFEWAAYSGHDKVIKLLLDRGIDANQRGIGCRSPISLAASGGWIKTINLLLGSGVEIESRCVHDRTPISWAASEGHREAVQLLLEKGADPYAKDKYGQTPLWWAVSSNWPDIVDLLLQWGCDPDSLDINSRTALCEAAENGYVAVIDILLKAGANADIKDRDGRTALDFALQDGHVETRKLLQENPSKVLWLYPEGIERDMGLSNLCRNDAPISWDNYEAARPFGKQPRTVWKCPFCVERPPYLAFAALKRHIGEIHFGKRIGNFKCLMNHVQETHTGYSTDNLAAEEYPVPSSCPTCGKATHSWVLFFSCVKKHAKTVN